MKKIKTVEAVGQVLIHDITQIIKGERTGVLFKKGHVVRKCDIEALLSVGKDHIYIYEADEGSLHENDAATILMEICTHRKKTFLATEVREGKIEILATCNGLLKVDVQRLAAVNALGEMIIASRHNNSIVAKGDKVAGTRIIPLAIRGEKMQKARDLAKNQPVLDFKPFHNFKVGVITTGNEIFYNRIADTFTPVIEKKLEVYGLTIDKHAIVADDVSQIVKQIKSFQAKGIQMILCTGGMSVDPDDVTPAAIKASGAKLLTYGVPVLPGSMLLIGYLDEEIPIIGLPGCVMYAETTGFDLIFPRILAKDKITKEEIAQLGHGGLCLKCKTCIFPHCGFGKGW